MMRFEPARRKRPSTEHRRSTAGNRSEQAESDPVEERPRSLSHIGNADIAAARPRAHQRARIVALDQPPGPEIEQGEKSAPPGRANSMHRCRGVPETRSTPLTVGIHEGAAPALLAGLSVLSARDVLEESDPVLVARLRPRSKEHTPANDVRTPEDRHGLVEEMRDARTDEHLSWRVVTRAYPEDGLVSEGCRVCFDRDQGPRRASDRARRPGGRL